MPQAAASIKHSGIPSLSLVNTPSAARCHQARTTDCSAAPNNSTTRSNPNCARAISSSFRQGPSPMITQRNFTRLACSSAHASSSSPRFLTGLRRATQTMKGSAVCFTEGRNRSVSTPHGITRMWFAGMPKDLVMWRALACETVTTALAAAALVEKSDGG